MVISSKKHTSRCQRGSTLLVKLPAQALVPVDDPAGQARLWRTGRTRLAASMERSRLLPKQPVTLQGSVGDESSQ